MHERFYFHHSNPESQAGFCILGQNHPFFDLNHKRLCHSPTFDLRAKLYMVSCTYPMIGSIDFATKLKINPKILFRYSADFNEQHS